MWFLDGTVRAKGRARRVRQNTKLPATTATKDHAEEERRQREKEIRDELLYGIHPSIPTATAIERYLNRSRQRPLNPIDIARLKEIDRKFGLRKLNQIPEKEWIDYVDKRNAGNAPTTRERYIDTVTSFLKWCQKKPRHWLSELPSFERDDKARYRKQRRARRVGELRFELITLLVENAAPHLRGQMAIAWSTGARTSSLIYGCRLCDYLAAEGREQITFHNTKNGTDVTAALHPWAVQVMRAYLEWRGDLDDREAPLFLTHFRQPYADNEKAWGGQTKTAFKGMVRRTQQALRCSALTAAARLREQGEHAAARARWAAARADIALLAQLTPHWFRHLLATNLLAMGDLVSTMEQGGWIDPRSVVGYARDVPERRRALVTRLASIGAVPALGRNKAGSEQPDQKKAATSKG
jgi:site-specific recombinase XerD